jgi:hypothetical protein
MVEFVHGCGTLQSHARAHLNHMRRFFAWERVERLQLEHYERVLSGTL